jgi:hypothetical protein
MVSFPNIERSAINLDAFQNLRNKYIRIGIAVAMGIGRQIVRHEIAAHADVLRNGFAVISRNTRRKVLWRFDPAGGGFNRVSGNRHGCAGASGIRVQQVLANKHFLSGIGGEHVPAVYIGSNGHGLHAGGNLAHSDCDLRISARMNALGHDNLSESLGINPDVELTGGRCLDFKSTVGPGSSLAQSLTF